MQLYRAIKGKRPRSSDFWSDFACGEDPIVPVQTDRPSMWWGVSMSDDFDRAKRKALELTQGRYIAVMQIPDDAEHVRTVQTSTKRDPHHYSVVGSPTSLGSCFVESVPIT